MLPSMVCTGKWFLACLASETAKHALTINLLKHCTTTVTRSQETQERVDNGSQGSITRVRTPPALSKKGPNPEEHNASFFFAFLPVILPLLPALFDVLLRSLRLVAAALIYRSHV